MKKIISMLAALTLLCSSVIIPAANADNISVKEVNAYSEEYSSQWPDIDAKHEQVKEDGFVFDVYDGYAYLTDYENTDATEVTIPDKINDIEVVGAYSSPFSKCSELESITLPDTMKYFKWIDLTLLSEPVTSADGSGEVYATVKEVKVSETNPYYTEKDGLIFSKDMKTLVGCPPAKFCSLSVLPDETDTIGMYAFAGNIMIHNIQIPKSIKTIMLGAFIGCDKLESVDLSSSVTEIQADTFSYCTSLTEVTNKRQLTAIGAGAFAECTSLKKFDIPSTVTYIGWRAFENAGCVEKEDNIYYVDNWCVGGDLNKLTAVYLREKTVGIAEMSFIIANRITEFVVPPTVKYMGTLSYAASRGDLTTIRFYGNTIKEGDFSGVKKLKDIYIYDYDCPIEDSEKTIPAKWKYVEDLTDYDALIKNEEENKEKTGTSSSNSTASSIQKAINTSIIELDSDEEENSEFPDSKPYENLPVISADEFDTPLIFGDTDTQPSEENVNEGDTVIHGFKNSSAEAYAKKYNRKFEIIRELEFDSEAEHEKFTEGDFEYLTDGEYAWLNACVNKDITEATIPEKANGMCVVGVTDDAADTLFEDCTKLEKIALNQHINPYRLSELGTKNCPVMNYDIAPDNDAPYTVTDGVVYSVKGVYAGNGQGIMQVPNGRKGEFVIPDYVEIIASEAFKNCSGLTSVIIGENVKKINFSAFEGCTSLKDVKLPEGLESIGENAFPENAYTETADGLSYVDGWLVAADESVREKDKVIIKDGTVGMANVVLDLKFGAELIIPATMKDCIDYPYHLKGPKIVHYYPACGYSNYLSSDNISDVYIYDPECDLKKCEINEHYIEDDKQVFPNNENHTIIHGYTGSTAETYAKEHKMEFKPIEEIHIHAPEETLKLENARILSVNETDDAYEIVVKGVDKPFFVTKKSEIYSNFSEHPLYVGDVVSGVLKIKSDDNIVTAIDLNTNSMGGDVNCDKSVDLADAVLIMQALANPDKYGENGTDETHLTAEGRTNADIEGSEDGMTNRDALAIQKRLLHLK